MRRKGGLLAILLLSLLFVACHRSHPPSSGLTAVRLQTDWYPQPEHGGFYTALLKGYYRDEGLDVTILPGGPYVSAEQQVSTGGAEFGMGSSDHILEAVSNGLPLLAVAATMQHDPQAIMVHADSPVHSFRDLEGYAVAAKPGSTWFKYIVKRYDLKNVREIPATYSIANFLQDPKYVQQIFVTSEPFFVKKAGIEARTLLISDAGYDPYRIFFTSQRFASEHPEVVKKFVRASLRGWGEYLRDPAPANEAISRLNPAMNPEQMAFIHKALVDGQFVTGKDSEHATLGSFSSDRWTSSYKQLADLKVIQNPIDPGKAYTTQFVQ